MKNNIFVELAKEYSGKKLSDVDCPKIKDKIIELSNGVPELPLTNETDLGNWFYSIPYALALRGLKNG